ncbi:MAG: FAD-binding oxidoreductase [Alphaproteobacteria bacterium]|nr:FAD-binding oxidoreductase [Alphaproteobacteria bacterium]
MSEFPKETEVVVVGAGIAGTMTAYFLAKRGVPVVVCEKGRVAGEQSSRNWGFVRKQGRDPRELPAVIESLRIWEGLEAELGEDIGWHQGGSLYLAENDDDLAHYERWMDFAREYQLDTRLLSPDEVDAQIGGEGRIWKGGMFTASDGRAEPEKAVPAVARALQRMGGTVLTECAVRTVERAAGKVIGVVTEKGPIACRAVVCAAGAWSSLFSRNLGHGFPQLKVRASVLRTKPAPLATESNVMSSGAGFRRRQDGGYTIGRSGAAIFEIVPDALRYFRDFQPGRKSQPGMKLKFNDAFFRELVRPNKWQGDQVTAFERYRVLDPAPDMAMLGGMIRFARQNFPQLGPVEIAEAWAGMIDVTPDAIPVMSAVDGLEGYFVATGFSGHGFGIGAGVGRIMAELAMGESVCVDLHPFRLARFTDGSPIELFSKQSWRG